jgi:hypothetical protein
MVRAVWLVLTGMMLVSRLLFQTAGARRMRHFLDDWKVGRVRQCWGAVSLALAVAVVVLLIRDHRDHRDLDALDWTLSLLLAAVLVADGSVNVLPSGFTTFKDRVQSAWVKRSGDARADDSRMFGVVNLGLAIAAAAMFAFVVLYRSASIELVAGAAVTAVIVTPLLVGLALVEGRR